MGDLKLETLLGVLVVMLYPLRTPVVSGLKAGLMMPSLSLSLDLLLIINKLFPVQLQPGGRQDSLVLLQLLPDPAGEVPDYGAASDGGGPPGGLTGEVLATAGTAGT